MTTYSRISNRLVRIQGTSPTLVYTPGEGWDVPVSHYYGLVKSLTARVRIRSLPAIVPPTPSDDFPSRESRYLLARDISWKSARAHLDLLLRVPGSDWQEVVTCSIQNHESIPYYTVDLLKYLSDNVAYGLGFGVELGAKLVDVGYGLPGAEDKVLITAEVHEEAQARPPVMRQCAPMAWSVGEFRTTIAPADSERQSVLLANRGEVVCWINRGAIASPGLGLPLEPGGTLEVGPEYLGAITAIAPGGPVAIHGEICK